MHNNVSNAWMLIKLIKFKIGNTQVLKPFKMIAIDVQFSVKTGTVKGKGIRVKMFSTQDVENLDPFLSRVMKN